MAEAAIVDAVSAAPEDGCCVYIVPFRALATEMEATLGATPGDLGIRVSSLFGGYETSDLGSDIHVQRCTEARAPRTGQC